ncbi:MAG: tripartite tricarboxylate transporter substrate binding protein BugD [Nonomuraea muscovyensis]|nr:tripartite tricarboxylate transporter substrate binding protein BugD [Nonomuraea muscovyensis]
MRPTSRYRAAARVIAAIGVVSLVAACSGNGGTAGGGAPGGGYPDQNITLVVPFSAGGPTDTVTRMIAEPMAAKLGTKVVVQNVEGAGGTVGAGEVARAKPDGYTVLMHHIGMSTAPALYKDLGYQPLESFETVGLVTEVPMTVVARKDFAPATLQDLVTYVPPPASSSRRSRTRAPAPR